MCSSLASGFRFARRGRPSKISSTTSAPEPIIGGARSDSPVSTGTYDTYREPHHGIRRYPTTYVPIVHTQDRRDSDTVSMPWQACGVEPPDVCAMDHGPVLPRRSAFAGSGNETKGGMVVVVRRHGACRSYLGPFLLPNTGRVVVDCSRPS